jgi:hypothetical protein
VYELLLMFGIVVALGGFALALHVLSIELLLAGGLWLVAAGLLIGLPASAVYHALLRRSLLRADALPRGWYWHPTALHGRIPQADRTQVLGWCFVAAAGFVGIMLGCMAVARATWRSA